MIEYDERPSPYPDILPTPCHISKKAKKLLDRPTVSFKEGDGRRNIGIPKLAWERANGKVVGGLYVCHKCDIPACCNTLHLFLGTAKENSDDKIRKGRAVFGSRGPRKRGYAKKVPNKLNPAKVREMRLRYASGEKQKDLAKVFGIACSGVSAIVLRKKWTHVA